MNKLLKSSVMIVTLIFFLSQGIHVRSDKNDLKIRFCTKLLQSQACTCDPTLYLALAQWCEKEEWWATLCLPGGNSSCNTRLCKAGIY